MRRHSNKITRRLPRSLAVHLSDDRCYTSSAGAGVLIAITGNGPTSSIGGVRNHSIFTLHYTTCITVFRVIWLLSSLDGYNNNEFDDGASENDEENLEDEEEEDDDNSNNDTCRKRDFMRIFAQLCDSIVAELQFRFSIFFATSVVTLHL
ncbi:hypothetical protein AVEN_272271-1 [Araneus ventricosus]|uniref:Uncharacterized protein n=1 Tax=Araneus ventricosus TaxID=182803 RepID=A0A4Y2SNS8_ARAVE|nr:hypothetical protein AVEN_272271-1 [Araneus ventricosus]